MGVKKNKKKAAAAAAVTLAAALILTGTFAWRSISQEALNENLVLANPGGRLHDDWNGTKKKVYVENFTNTTYDPDHPGQTIENSNQAPIYVRVRLQEYLEMGKDAGLNFEDPDRKVTPLIPTMDFEDKSTWPLYLPGNTQDLFQDYVKIETERNTQLKYMPTFNKNQESLKADINGTYEGTTKGDKVHFDDYIDYEDANTAVNKQDDAYYYEEDSTEPLGTIPGSEVPYKKNVGESHEISKTLATEKIITMAEWLQYDGVSPDQKKTGNYWVFDEDGWAYWANPLMPGTATGPLITDVSLKKAAGGNCYYAINVVGEFASEDDWGDPEGGDKETLGFYYNGITDNALDLLNKITKNFTADNITVTGAEKVKLNDQATYTAEVTARGKKIDNQKVDWTVAGNTSADTAIDTNGLLSVGADETANELKVTATSQEYTNLSKTVDVAVASTPMTITVADHTVTVNLNGDVTMTPDDPWETINLSSYKDVRNVVVNGNNHAISGMDKALVGYCQAGGVTIEINDLTIEDSEMTQTQDNSLGYGAFVEVADNCSSVVLKNCHLKDTKIQAINPGGGLVGYSSAVSLKIIDCSVEGVEITGADDIGGMIGACGYGTVLVKDSKTQNATLTSTKSGLWRVGHTIGTVQGAGTVNFDQVTYSGGTLTQNNSTGTYSRTYLIGRSYITVTGDTSGTY